MLAGLVAFGFTLTELMDMDLDDLGYWATSIGAYNALVREQSEKH